MRAKAETLVGIFVLSALMIFLYMGFKIGAFRFDRSNYAQYAMYFKDISGLTRKADVKIAGVSVGWVEAITLHADDTTQAQATVMIQKDYNLYQDARAVVRQDGLLGPKYLELVPGDPATTLIPDGGTLDRATITPVSIDDVIRRFGLIAANVESITDSLKEVVGGDAGKEQLRGVMQNLNLTAERMAAFSGVLERSFGRNEEHIDALLEVGSNIRGVTYKLEHDVLPMMQDSMERIGNAFDRDFDRVAGSLASTAQAVEEASLQARDGFVSLTSVAGKIDEGKGLLGKLVNEDETYHDLKVAVGGLKNYFAKVDSLQIVFDAHGETMHRPAENYRHEDSKFYVDMRVHPNTDHFYLVQLTSSEKGWRSEWETQKVRFNNDGTVVPQSDFDPKFDAAAPPRERVDLYTRNTVKIGFQFGKIFKDLAFRIGLFEGCGGVAVDYDIPFETEKLRWVTSFEAFDLNGWNRKNDRRPHLKWINRMFVLRNIYFTFGADDFVSKRNANAFFGVGLRFGDDDVKYLLPNLGSVRGLGT